MGKTSQHELSYEVWRRVIRCMPHPPPPAGEGIIKGPFVLLDHQLAFPVFDLWWVGGR